MSYVPFIHLRSIFEAMVVLSCFVLFWAEWNAKDSWAGEYLGSLCLAWIWRGLTMDDGG